MTDNSSFEDQVFKEEINISLVLKILWRGKILIGISTLIFLIIAIIISLSLPNIYISKAILAPVQTEDSRMRALQNYGGLATLAGISITPDSGNNSVEAIKKMESLSFFENQILEQIFLPDLMAFSSWDSSKNTNYYLSNRYDEESKSWKRKGSDLKKVAPTPQESFRKFQSIMTLSTEKSTGFLTVEIEHQSPYLAKQWVELVVSEINSFMRTEKKIKSEKSINFLNNQMAMTNLAEVKQVLSELIQDQIQQLTLIEANEDYVFKYIDPPAVMEKKSKPNRALIVILGAFFGGLFGMLLVFVQKFRKS